MTFNEIFVAFFLLVGIFFILTGTAGLIRLPDLYNRMHAPTKATTLGVSSIILAAVIHFHGIILLGGFKELLAILFLFLTAPVGAHLLVKAAYHLKVTLCEKSICDERREKIVIGIEDEGWDSKDGL